MPKVIIKAQFNDPAKRTATATLKAGIEIDSALIIEPVERAFQKMIERLKVGQFKEEGSSYRTGTMEVMLFDEKTGEYSHTIIGVIEGQKRIGNWTAGEIMNTNKEKEKLKSLIINHLNDE